MTFLPLNKPSEALMFDLINRDNGTKLTPDDVFFISVDQLADEDVDFFERNTEIVLQAKSDSRYYGQKTMYFNRLDLETLVGTEVVYIETPFTTFQEAIAGFNDDYGLSISEDEYMPAHVDENGRVVLEISDSIVYVPGSKIILGTAKNISQFEQAVDEVWYFANYTLADAINI